MWTHLWCTTYDTKLHLMVRLQFCRSWEWVIHLHYNYSQVHSKWQYYLLGFHLWLTLINLKIIRVRRSHVQKKGLLKKQTQKNVNMKNNVRDSLTSRHRLTLDGLTCRWKSVVAGSISSGGDYGIYCWCDLIIINQSIMNLHNPLFH